jgi:hypothetical protein
MKIVWDKLVFAWYWVGAKVLGKNVDSTPPQVILAQMAERRPLPIGRKEFEEWADRILSGANVEANRDDMKAALCGMVMHLGPTESFKEDAFFIHSLRKISVNQTVYTIMQELQAEAKRRAAEKETENETEVQGIS